MLQSDFVDVRRRLDRLSLVRRNQDGARQGRAASGTEWAEWLPQQGRSVAKEQQQQQHTQKSSDQHSKRSSGVVCNAVTLRRSDAATMLGHELARRAPGELGGNERGGWSAKQKRQDSTWWKATKERRECRIVKDCKRQGRAGQRCSTKRRCGAAGCSPVLVCWTEYTGRSSDRAVEGQRASVANPAAR